MVVTAAIVLVLVAGDAIAEGDFAGKSATGQQFEGAIDGRKADTRIFLLHETVQFISGEMLTRFQKRTQDGVALPGLLEAHAAEVLEKNRFGLAHAFARG